MSTGEESAPGAGDPGEEMVDPRVFIKRLAPHQLGLFEPLSGLMLLNISRQELFELSGRLSAGSATDFDRAIIHTINHEAYHFAQVAGSGYVFHRQARLLRVFNAIEPVPEPEIPAELQELFEAAREEAERDPELRPRYDALVAMIRGHNRFAQMSDLAEEGDHSVEGALRPGFFAHLKELAQGERVPNGDGLSIRGVLEGSAVIHSRLLRHTEEDPTPHIEAELATLPAEYRELFDVTVARAGERALELVLPAVALALRFMQPHDAYLPVLALLADSSPGQAVDYGRGLIDRLGEITSAGPLLGTALDLRRMDGGYLLYDRILGSLESGEWGIDSYDLLAHPPAMHAVGTFPLGIVTTDGYLGSLDSSELAARMVLMGAVLRTQSRRRAERDFHHFQADWARSVINRLVSE